MSKSKIGSESNQCVTWGLFREEMAIVEERERERRSMSLKVVSLIAFVIISFIGWGYMNNDTGMTNLSHDMKDISEQVSNTHGDVCEVKGGLNELRRVLRGDYLVDDEDTVAAKEE